MTKKTFAHQHHARPQVEYLNAGKGESMVYSVSDTSVLAAANPELDVHSIVFLKPGTEEVLAGSIIEALDKAGGSPETAGWGGSSGLNIEGKSLPYLVVKGDADAVKSLLENAGLVPHPYLWSGIEQAATAGYTIRHHSGPPERKGPHLRGFNGH